MNDNESCFRRKNFDKLNYFEIYTIGLVLLPIRSIGFVLTALSYFVIVRTVIIFEPKVPYTHLGKWIIKKSGNLLIWFMVLSCGFLNMKEKKAKIKDFIPDYEENEQQ